MVRAGVVTHPQHWKESGYHQIQNPPERYRIVDLELLTKLFDCSSLLQLQRQHMNLINNSLTGNLLRDTRFTVDKAVGDISFITGFNQHKEKLKRRFIGSKTTD
ncbi:MAG: hypothetical protein HKM24_07250 [Gammaproteobacteria bacterium]|nr:hypothetical protein [Gammaproteobacteria bacterium]